MQKNITKRCTDENTSLRELVNHADTALEIAEEIADNESVPKKIQKQSSVPFFKEAPHMMKNNIKSRNLVTAFYIIENFILFKLNINTIFQIVKFKCRRILYVHMSII